MFPDEMQTLRFLCTATLLVGFLATALSCSGPHVQETIASVLVTSRTMVGVLLIQGVFSWLLRRRAGVGIGHPALFGLLLAINPGIWSNPYAGDCGATMFSGATLFLIVGTAATLAQVRAYLRWRQNRFASIP